jgi:hypothetical protein
MSQLLAIVRSGSSPTSFPTSPFIKLSLYLSLSVCRRSSLKEQCHEIFCFGFFSWIILPGSDNSLRVILKKNRNGPNGILRGLGETDSYIIFFKRLVQVLLPLLYPGLKKLVSSPIPNNVKMLLNIVFTRFALILSA